MNSSPLRKAVIPAAGFGTRMLPVTKAVPKEMLPILDRPTIQLVVEEAASIVDDILLITSRDKRAIEDHFDRNNDLENRLKSGGGNDGFSQRAAVHDSPSSKSRGICHRTTDKGSGWNEDGWIHMGDCTAKA